jgi:antitoxin CcdA
MQNAARSINGGNAGRQRTNVSLDAGLLKAARSLGLNLSRACEQGLLNGIQQARAERWLEENRDAVQGSNEYVEKHGVPLSRFRQF